LLVEEKTREVPLNERMFNSLITFRKTSHGMLITIIVIAIVMAVSLLTIVVESLQAYSIMFPISIYAVLAVGGIFAYRFELRQRELAAIFDDYSRHNYFFSVQTLQPEGKSRTEKFLSIAQAVFPSINLAVQKSKEEDEKWKIPQETYDGCTFDMALDTKDGIFLLKHFDKIVKFSDVEKMLEAVRNSLGRKKIFRIVCLASEYDQIFLDDNFDEKMNKLERKEKLDLFLERENGYSTIWID